ncbi:MAG: Flp family type IVb pilin [Bdellovibrionales bacterium]|nr:Flp family type IVb pilin [Bdellovibrionales bacterium]
MRVTKSLKSLRSERGATTSEYAFIVGLLNVALVFSLSVMSMQTSDAFTVAANAIGGGSSSSLDGNEVIVTAPPDNSSSGGAGGSESVNSDSETEMSGESESSSSGSAED